jgi:hypothetical protein
LGDFLPKRWSKSGYTIVLKLRLKLIHSKAIIAEAILSAVVDRPDGGQVGGEAAQVPCAVLAAAHAKLLAIVQRPETDVVKHWDCRSVKNSSWPHMKYQ